MSDSLAESRTRLEQLLEQVKTEPDSDKADELLAEIRTILAERDRIRTLMAARDETR